MYLDLLRSQLTAILTQIATRYRIKHCWVYMLLGQIVAISFAQNLFYLDILLSTPPHDRQKGDSKDRFQVKRHGHPSSFVTTLPLLISLLSTLAIPSVVQTRHFLAVLLVPHLLLFMPTLVSYPDSKTTVRWARWLTGMLATASLLLQLKVTVSALENNSLKTILETLTEHPAVSSVGLDVIFCTVSSVTWLWIHKFRWSALGEDVMLTGIADGHSKAAKD